MSKIIDTSNEEELQETCGDNRDMASYTQAGLMSAENVSPLSCVPPDQLTEGQTHIELGKTTINSTGKSVSVDEVLANIDKALETDKE